MMRLTHTLTRPCQEENMNKPVPRLEQTLDRAEWDFLVSERAAIMHEAGMVSSRCLPMALADTTRAHGQRPGVAQ